MKYNKFVIRELENQRKNIDKKLAKARKSEDKRLNSIKYKTCIEKTEHECYFEKDAENDSDKMKFSSEKRIKYTSYLNEVTCTITDDKYPSIKAVGVSNCCKDDEFTLYTGMAIAESRARVEYQKSVNKIVEGNFK